MAPSIEAEAVSQSIAAPTRQRAGAACDECRRRKLRCNGQQPQCSVCQESGLVCEITQRGVRGPKKGYLKALKNRVVHLEALLESRADPQQQHQQRRGDTGSSSNITISTPPVDISDTSAVNYDQSWLPVMAGPISESEMLPSNNSLPDLTSLSEWPPISTLPVPIEITNVMRTELDQLYFDRVHTSIPILHQRRYMSWSKSSTKTSSQICLQHAMWTLASMLSVQTRDMMKPLYHKTKQMLEAVGLEGTERSSCHTELVQAWVLIATCESMLTYHREAWMSVGRLFRLVQGMRFHEIDSPKNSSPRNNSPSNTSPISSPPNGDFIETEEKRRVFWMAYFLDHLFSMRNDWPVTLNEHVICTRLPAPDMEFQSGQQVLGDFLSEAMTEPSLKVQSSFNECLILVTISGRSLLHNQQYNINKAYGEMALDLGEQRQWLDNILMTRLQVLSQCYPSPIEINDPLILFANILGQATVIYHCKGMIESVASPIEAPESNTKLLECQQWALAATSNIIRFARALCELHFSKIHPLMPIPLFLTAEFLYDNRSGDESFYLRLQELVDIFRELKTVHNPEKSYLSLLPESCISKSIDLLNHTTELEPSQ